MKNAKILAEFSLIRRAARERQRGFTLIELAIALAVVGLLLGASLVPMRILEERRQLRDEMRRMEILRDTIVGYALRHRTRARTIKFVDERNPNVRWEFHLPGGRPYLPCPDWDGDGFEDRLPENRSGFLQGLEVRPTNLAVVATVSVRDFRNYPGWGRQNLMINELPDSYPYGECRILKGAVPWRTLGSAPADGWGNRHTYYADPAFSNAIFGFDRQTIADIYDSRIPSGPGFGSSPRQRSRGGLAPQVQNQQCPAVICDGGRTKCDDERLECGGRAGNSACALHDFQGGGIPPSQCAWKWDLANLALKAGSVAQSEIVSESSGGKYFPAGGVTDGIPFVLVSHGPNGRFAVNHWATLNGATDFLGIRGPVCNHSAWADVNFILPPRYSVPLEDSALIHEAMNGFRTSSGLRCGGMAGIMDGETFPLNQSFFVWEPPGIGDKSGFDDLLLWMTREELSLAVPGRIPPLPRMVVAYFP